METKDWYEMQDLADDFRVPVARVRQVVGILEETNQIQVRDRPGDKRYKQVSSDSVATIRKVILGA